jgi:hypothetical protein
VISFNSGKQSQTLTIQSLPGALAACRARCPVRELGE